MTAARERMVLVLAVVAAGGITVLASTQPFASVRLSGQTPVSVAGSAVAPVLAPLGIVAVALAAALAIAGRGARRVLAVVLVLLGAGVVGAALPAAMHPAAGVGGAVTARTGITGAAALAALTVGTAASAWPVVAAADGVLLAGLGAALAIRSPRWPTGGRRYRTPVAPAPESSDPIAEWDSLTAGADPTEDR